MQTPSPHSVLPESPPVEPLPDSTRPIFLIAGGVGPMAGVLLHERMVRNTTGTRADCDHLDIIHFSRVSDMPDRTGFVSGQTPHNPGTAMAEVMRTTARSLGAAGRTWHVVVPCATFHTPVIFEAFRAGLTPLPGFGALFSLIETTADHIRTHPDKPRRIGVLSTKGSHAMGTWRTPLRAAGIDCVELDARDAGWMHDAIYHPDYGLKARFPPDPRAIDAALKGCAMLRDLGADAVIMGCTELSLIADHIHRDAPEGMIGIDPLTVIAKLCADIGRPDLTTEPDQHFASQGRMTTGPMKK